MYSFVKTAKLWRLNDNKSEFLQTISQHSDKSTGDDAKKVNAKVGSIFADNWADKAGDIKNNAEFATSFENYLKNELEFAKHVKINCDEKNYYLDIKGCAICHGNEILRKRRHGNSLSYCPGSQVCGRQENREKCYYKRCR